MLNKFVSNRVFTCEHVQEKTSDIESITLSAVWRDERKRKRVLVLLFGAIKV